MDGVLAVNKPAGITSYDVIRRVKRLLPKGTKIGHGGTLDPFAEGVLLILVGKATKKFAEIQLSKKTYLATAKLGAGSNTLDSEGKIENVPVKIPNNLTVEVVQQVADKYVGEIEQEVPKYSAAKYKGRKLYEYAREGKEVPAKSKKVHIYSIEVDVVTREEVGLRVVCGSGTYIRQLSYELLRELGVESYLDKLVRERIGAYGLSDCVTLEQLVHEDEVRRRLRPFRGE